MTAIADARREAAAWAQAADARIDAVALEHPLICAVLLDVRADLLRDARFASRRGRRIGGARRILRARRDADEQKGEGNRTCGSGMCHVRRASARARVRRDYSADTMPRRGSAGCR